MRKKSKKKKRKIKYVLVAVLALIIITGALMLFKIKDIDISQNQKVSDEEIIEYVFTGKYDYHTLLFYLKSKFLEKPIIPFVETYDVKLKSLSSINITIVEKTIVGCIEYMGNYMYFDKNGIVEDSAGTLMPNVPIVTGLDFGYIVIHEELPIENKGIFNLLLDITQMLKNYEIIVDSINLTPSHELVLYIENVKVVLGKKEKLNEKISDLKDIVGQIDGLTGTLDMSIYDESKKGYWFKTSE